MSPRKTKETPTSRIRRRNFGKNHAYYLQTENGEVKLDGVTTLLSNGMRKEAIENWSANETAGYAVEHWDELAALPLLKRLDVLKKARYEVRDAAARRGTEIHALAEKILHGEEVAVPEEIAGHVNSAVRFLDEWKVRPIITETTVFNPLGMYAGTLDMVFTSDVWNELHGEQRVIIGDWKSSRSGIFGETALQLSAYENAKFYQGADGLDHPMSELGIVDAWAIWVRSDAYSVYPMVRGPEVYRTFGYVAETARRTGGKERPLDLLKGDELFLPHEVAA